MIFKYLSIHFRSKIQYKASFIFLLLGQFIHVLVSGIATTALFDKFGLIDGFTVYEALISFAIVQLGFSLAEMLGRGFDSFKKLIKNGTFDLILIKPRSIFLQIIGSNIAYEKFGMVIAALITLMVALYNVEIISLNRLLLIIPMILSSTIIFFSIFIIGAAFTFYTIEGLEVINIFTFGSRTAGQYPIGVFNKYFVYFFTFIVPLSCVNYFPVLYLLGKSNNIVYMLSPLMGFITLIPAILIFNQGLKKYQGAGS